MSDSQTPPPSDDAPTTDPPAAAPEGAPAAEAPAGAPSAQPAPAAQPAPTGPTFVKRGVVVHAPTPIGQPQGGPAGAAPAAAEVGAVGQAYVAHPSPTLASIWAEHPVPRRFAVVVFVLALLGGLFVTEARTGLGLAILGVGLVAALALLERPYDLFDKGILIGAGLLAAVPLLRDSGWVTSLSLLGALTLASIAVAPSRSWREVGVGAFVWWGHLVPAPFVVFADATRRTAHRRWSLTGPVLRGIALAAVLVLVFGGLFAWADRDFARLVRDIFDIDLDLVSVLSRILVFVAVLTVAGAMWMASASAKERPARPATSRLGRTEWLIALVSLVVVFAVFVALQLPDLFNDDDAIRTTAGLTYASNARLGFGQLTLAALLTLSVVAAASHFGPVRDRIVEVLNGALCLLTIVILISALHRLGLYQDAYGATRTRFSMHALMLWIGAVFVATIVFGAIRRTAWLPRVVVGLAAVFSIATVAVNPDGRIAARNIDRYESTGGLDTRYLTTMSADAVPAIRELPPELRACVAREFGTELPRSDSPASLNVARSRARSIVREAARGDVPESQRRPCAQLVRDEPPVR